MEKSSQNSFLKRYLSLFFLFMFLGVSTGALVQCRSTPVTGRRALQIVPAAQVQQLGQEAFQEIKQQEPLLQDPRITQEIVEIGQRVAQASQVDFEWEFAVFDAPDTVNAFCLPGGKIGVYTGILPVALNNAGLAAIMGHEVAHATARHADERLSQGLLIQAGLTLADLSLSNARFRGQILGLLGVGAQVGVLLPYSRRHELESDRIGLEYMARAGYDPREAVTLWQRMAELGGGGGPNFLATHPDPLIRAQEIEQVLADVMPLYEQSQRVPTQRLSSIPVNQ